MFLASVGFGNFLGAGIFGFLINLPIVSYYEIGTALTANHGHAAMMGVYGMLSVGLALFCQRYMIPEERWSDRAAKISFWSLNLGLAWMVVCHSFSARSAAVVSFRQPRLFQCSDTPLSLAAAAMPYRIARDGSNLTRHGEPSLPGSIIPLMPQNEWPRKKVHL